MDTTFNTPQGFHFDFNKDATTIWALLNIPKERMLQMDILTKRTIDHFENDENGKKRPVTSSGDLLKELLKIPGTLPETVFISYIYGCYISDLKHNEGRSLFAADNVPDFIKQLLKKV